MINDYFEKKSVNMLKKKTKNIDIITFTNVFAHISNFRNLIINLKKIIGDQTLLVIENHYLGSVLKKTI